MSDKKSNPYPANLLDKKDKIAIQEFLKLSEKRVGSAAELEDRLLMSLALACRSTARAS